MYILYGTETQTPIIYKELDTIMLNIIKNRNNGECNKFYQNLKNFSYSNQEYNLYYDINIVSSNKYKILDYDSNDKLLEFIYNDLSYNVYIVNNKVLYECLLYCKTIYKIVEDQMMTFDLDDDFLCHINVLVVD